MNVPITGYRQISTFDPFFKKYAHSIDWDWRLLASVSFQESRFLTDRASGTGATGLMGLMPKTAEAFGLSADRINDPEMSIKAACGFIKRLNRFFASIENKEERILFVLAAYNSGPGHVQDAQALAAKYGKDPQKWEDVEEYLKLKNQPEYYNDPVCRSGFLRGAETNTYVQDVIERWRYYQRKVKET